MRTVNQNSHPINSHDDEFQERAAILEFDGGVNRKEAELKARHFHPDRDENADSDEQNHKKEGQCPPYSAESFLNRKLPEKQELVESLLFLRDLIAMAGRRRHGKTNLLLNLALALILGGDFLGYPIKRRLRVAALFLEDDAREIQDKLKRMLRGRESQMEGRLSILTRQDFTLNRISISVTEQAFRNYVDTVCKKEKPDLIIFDNMAQLVGADYSNPKLMHQLANYGFGLTLDHNCAVLFAAHPRKRPSGDTQSPRGLREDPEAFFEEVMGSSHFVNSCGSLWGLERDPETDETIFLGGAQRVTGEQSLVRLSKDEFDWFQVVSDLKDNLEYATKTQARRKAWPLLPTSEFSYLEGFQAVKSQMRSQSTFHLWWQTLIRLNLVSESQSGRYTKAEVK